jgi:hypothetical protein
MFAMLQKPEVMDIIGSGVSYAKMATELVKRNTAEVKEILEIIDETPVDGANVLPRFISMFLQMMTNDYWRDFFGFAEIPKTSDNSGSAMENTEDSQM